MIKKSRDELENAFELLENKKRDVAYGCHEKDGGHEYSDYTFDRGESPWTVITGYILRRIVRRYRCRKCHKAISKKKLKKLKQIREFENFLKRNTR